MPLKKHSYADYGWLRGLNVIPSWGARIEQAWWSYDPQRVRAEMALARVIHANCIRLWIEFTAWMADPETVTARFLDAVAAIDECGMKTMPCLFNRWHDTNWDYGGTYGENFRGISAHREYVRAIVTPLKGDARILIWDLCNEPSALESDTDEFRWLEAIAREVRAIGASQPITIGTHMVGNGANMDTYAPLCDVLCCHPYSRTPQQLKDDHAVCRAVQAKHRKPMLCNECVPGSLNDLARAECAQWTIAALEREGWGWMGWGLREGLAIATRRDRIDSNGLDGCGFHAWFTREGQLRAHMDFLKAPPSRHPPWV